MKTVTQTEATQKRRIDSLESVEIGGTTQWVLLRGNPLAGRVLLIVQQGPGLPLIHEADAIERRLRIEPHVLVAYWDQRGTGRSCDADTGALDLARLVGDVREMVDTLCARLHVARVDIAGFSLGATLATMAARDPARIGCVVAVGIDVDFAESERYAYAFARDEAARRGDRRALRQLREIGAPPHDTSKRFLTRGSAGSPNTAASSGAWGSLACCWRMCGCSCHRRTTRSGKRSGLCARSR